MYNNISESFYSNEASATTPETEIIKKSGGGCSVIAGNGGQTVDIAIMLIPLVAIFMAIVRRKR